MSNLLLQQRRSETSGLKKLTWGKLIIENSKLRIKSALTTVRRGVAILVLLSLSTQIIPVSIINYQFSIPRASAAAGIYRPINYQAKVTSINGAAISDGRYNMRFRIYDAATSGNLKWSETWDNTTSRVTMTGGLFSVALGTHVTMTGSVDFNSDSLYLQVEFDPGNDGTYEETFAPRRRFGSVPYAHNANTLDGLDSTQFVRSDTGATMSGTLTIRPRNASKIGLDIISTAATAGTGGLRISTQGANHIVFGSGNSLYDVNLYRFSANVLKTDDSFFVGGTLSASGSLFTESGATFDGGTLHVAAGPNRVGIGTTSPASALHIIDTSVTGGEQGLRIQTNATDATAKQARIKVGHYTNAEEPVSILIADSNATESVLYIGGGYSSVENAMTSIVFATAANNTTVQGTERMRIISNGYLGIGTTTPKARLTVAGSGAFTGTLSGSALNIQGGTSYIRGNLGIGTTSPKTALDVLGTVSGSNVYTIGSVSGTHLYAARTFGGAGLADCDTAGTSKLLWDATTKQFSCGSDQGAGGTSTGALQAAFDNRYVNTSGDTMTGALTINLASGTVGLEVIQTISGSTVFANNRLVSSGTLVTESGATFDGGTLHIAAGPNRVGIGTTSPDTALEVIGTVSGSLLRLGGSSISAVNDGDITMPGAIRFGRSTELAALRGDVVANRVDIEATNGLALQSAALILGASNMTSKTGLNVSSSQLVLYTGGTEGLRIHTSGNVGIATTTPKAKFTVAGSGAFTGTLSGSALNIQGGTSYIRGRLGIGTTGPAVPLDVLGTTDVATFTTASTSANDSILTLTNGAAVQMVVRANGNVGIGKTSPSTKLDVVGTISGALITQNGAGTNYLRGNLAIGKTTASAPLDVLAATDAAIFTTASTSSADAALTFINGVGTQFIIRGNGKIGAGTSTPGSKLSVSGAVVISANGNLGSIAADAGLALEVLGTASGTDLFATKSISGSHLYAASTFGGAGLGDCDTAGTSKLLWDATTKRFSCGTDQNTTSFSTGSLMSAFDNRYVNTSGDTMTGALTINVTGGSQGTIGLKIINTLSGASLHAENLLTSSGRTIIEMRAATATGLTVRGAASQSAALQVWENSAGAILGKVTADGLASFQSGQFGGGTFPSAGAGIELVYSGGQGYINSWDRSTGAKPLAIATSHLGIGATTGISGSLRVGSTSAAPTNKRLYIDTLGTGEVGLTVVAIAAQTANLTEWHNSAGTPIAFITPSGSGSFKSIAIGKTPVSGRALEVIGTISGSNLFASRSISGTHLYAASTFGGAGLADCDTAGTSKLLWDATTKQFSCGTDATGSTGFSTGSLLSAFDNRYVNTSGDTMTGALTINLTSGTVGLEVIQTISGSVIHANTLLRSSGTLVVESGATFDGGTFYVDASGNRVGIGTTSPKAALDVLGTSSGTNIYAAQSVSGAHLYAAVTFGGAGLADCDTAGTSKLLWDATTKRFSCGTDTDTNTQFSGTGALQTAFDGRYVNTSGDTMTGALTINVTGGSQGTIGLKIINTLSGASLHAENLLTSSGRTIIEMRAATATGLTVRGAASQSAALQVWENSAGTAQSLVTPTGQFGIGYVGSMAAVGGLNYSARFGDNIMMTNNTALAFVNAAGSSNVQALKVDGSDNLILSPGSSGQLQLWHQGTARTALTNTTWTFQNLRTVGINATSASHNPFYVRGATAQTVNLTEWQDASATALSWITASGAMVIKPAAGAPLALNVVGTASGSNLFATKSITGSHLYAARTFGGAGLADCDTAGTSKLLWDATTKQFSCGTDTNTQFTGTGALQTAFDGRYVNTSGDTMTGALVIRMTTPTSVGLNVIGTMSGRSLIVSGTGAATAPLIFTHVPSGKVGIGTSTPTAKLHVVGGNMGTGASALTVSGNFPKTNATTTYGASFSFTGLRDSSASTMYAMNLAMNSSFVASDQTGTEWGGLRITTPDVGSQGVVYGVKAIGSPNSSTSYGVYGDGGFGGNSAYGLYGTVSGGPSAYGVYGESSNTGGSRDSYAGAFRIVGNVTRNAYGVYTTPANSPTISGTYYGVYSTINGATVTGNKAAGLFLDGTRTVTLANGTYSGLFQGGNVGIGTATPDTALEVVGAVSGSTLFATTRITSSGTLLTESGATFDAGTLHIAAGPNRVGIGTTSPSTFLQVVAPSGQGDGALVQITSPNDYPTLQMTNAQTSGQLGFTSGIGNTYFTLSATSGKVALFGSTDVKIKTENGFTQFVGLNDVSTMRVNTANNRVGIGKANIAPGAILSVSGAVIIGNNVGSIQAQTGTLLEILGTASGQNLFASKSISGTHLYAASTFGGAGLADCDTAGTSKLLWDATNKVFSCGTDQTGGAAFSTGSLMGAFDARYVNTSGDTMTGALTINLTSGTVGLEVIQTISGSTIFANNRLVSSGTLVTESGAYINGTSLVVQKNGNVGIGTASPADPLHIFQPSSDFSYSGLRIATTGTSAGGFARMRHFGNISSASIVGVSLNLGATAGGATTRDDATKSGWGFTLDNRTSSDQFRINYFDGTDYYPLQVFSTSLTKIAKATTTTAPQGQLEVVSSGLAVKTLVLQGATAQTANLTEWQNAAGTALSWVTASGAMVIKPAANAPLALNVIGTASGQNLFATKSITGSHLYAARTFGGAGLADCDTAGSSKLLWDATNKVFSCGTDQSASFSTGSLMTAFDARYVNTSGDTMTGALVLTPTGGSGSLALRMVGRQTVTGSVVIAASAKGIKPLIVKGVAGQTANLQEWQDSTGTARAFLSLGTPPVGSDTGYFALKPGSRSYFISTSDGGGSMNFGREDSTNALTFTPNSDNVGLGTIAGSLILRGSSPGIWSTNDSGGTGLIQFGRRFSDSTASVGASVEFWTNTSQTLPAIRIKKPGGASGDYAAFGPTGALAIYNSGALALSVAGTISGAILKARDLITSSGTLVTESGATFDGGTLHIAGASNRVGIGTTSPQATLQVVGGDLLLDNSQHLQMKDAGGNVEEILQLYSDDNIYFDSPRSFFFRNSDVGGGNLQYAKLSSGGLIVNGTGLSSIGGSLGIGTSTPGNALEVIGTASGTNLFATKSISGAHLYASSTFGGAGLTDCDTALSSKLLWDAATKTFSCGTDQSGGGSVGFSTGSLLSAFDNRYVRTAGSTMTGALTINLTSGTVGLEVIQAISGSVIHANTLLRSSGSLVTESGAYIDGSTLYVAAASNQVGIRTTSVGGHNQGYSLVVAGSITGSSLTAAGISVRSIVPGRYVASFGNTDGSDGTQLRISNDSIQGIENVETGVSPLYINPSGGAVGIGKGTQPKATLEVVGSISGSSLRGMGLTDCDTAVSSKLLWDATTGQFSCGTDQTGGGGVGFSTGSLMAAFDTRYVNTSGDTMTGALVINVTGGTSNTVGLEVINTISGSVLHANTLLRSSGAIVVESGANIDTGTFSVDAAGNKVGINTTAPKTALEVAGTVSGAALIVSGRAAFAGSGIILTQSGQTVFNEQSRNVDFRIESDNNANMFFLDASADRIGIGTTDPKAMFGVAGTVSGAALIVSGRAAFAGSGIILTQSGQTVFNEQSRNVDFRIESDNNANMFFLDASADRIGIGTTDPKAMFGVAGTMSGTSLVVSRNVAMAGSGILFSLSGSAVFNEQSRNVDFRIESDNNASLFFLDASADRIGIGTTAPRSTFSVVGTISGSTLRADTTLASSGVIIVKAPALVGSGALTVVHNAEFGTGAYVTTSGAALLALDATGRDSRTPHILFGYKGNFDTALWRSAASTLSLSGSLMPGLNAKFDLGSATMNWKSLFLGSGAIISRPQRQQFIGLKDTTNNRVSGIFAGSGSPVTRVAAGTGSIYTDNYTGRAYLKTKGIGTTGWEQIITGSGENALHMARMTRAAAQTIPTAELTLIDLDTETYDIGGIASTTSDRVTIKKSGMYLVTGMVGLGVVADGTTLAVFVTKNGGSFLYGSQVPGNAANLFPQVSDVAYLVAGDYLELHALQNSGGDRNTATAVDGVPRLTVTQLGIAAGADLAELYYTTDNSIVPGTLVSADPAYPAMVRKSSGVNDSALLGVMSSEPGLILSGAPAQPAGTRQIPLALAGRVPVLVSTENGPIAAGDLLGASSVPGVAMKSNGGATIGRALEPWTGSGISMVTTFVNLSPVGNPAADSFVASGTVLHVKSSLFSLSGALKVMGNAHFGSGVVIASQTTSATANLLTIKSNVDGTQNTVMRVDAGGNAFADGNFTGGGADYAEYFKSSTPGLQQGEAVCIDVTSENTVKRCDRPGDNNVIGIVSHPKQAAFIGNKFKGLDGLPVPGTVLVGLIGQVKTKVMVESASGAIRAGDSLTPASVPGYVRKAKAGESTVGVALQPFDGAQGVIDVLISRRNQSLTVEAVEENVLKTIANMEIGDEIALSISSAMEAFNLTEEVASIVTAEIETMDLDSRIARIIAEQLALREAATGSTVVAPSDDVLLSLVDRISALESRSTTTGSGTFTSIFGSIEDTLSVGGDTRVGGDLYLEGALLADSLFVPGAVTVDGTFSANRVEMGSGSTANGLFTVNGDLLLNGSLRMGSGSSMQLSDLIIDNTLYVMGDVTIAGVATFFSDVKVQGELIVSSKQAGYASIPLSGTSVTVLFSSGGFMHKPVVTASPDVPVLYAVSKTTQTGFTIRLAAPAAEAIIFSWLALSTEEPKTAEGHAAAPGITFPIDSLGYPLSDSVIWNACIRNQVTVDVDGQPYSCSRYHVDSTWTHPDLNISFVFNGGLTPPYLKLPEGYDAVVTQIVENLPEEEVVASESSSSSSESSSEESVTDASSSAMSSETAVSSSEAAVEPAPEVAEETPPTEPDATLPAEPVIYDLPLTEVPTAEPAPVPTPEA